jgi:hypothetical protein
MITGVLSNLSGTASVARDIPLAFICRLYGHTSDCADPLSISSDTIKRSGSHNQNRAVLIVSFAWGVRLGEIETSSQDKEHTGDRRSNKGGARDICTKSWSPIVTFTHVAPHVAVAQKIGCPCNESQHGAPSRPKQSSRWPSDLSPSRPSLPPCIYLIAVR